MNGSEHRQSLEMRLLLLPPVVLLVLLLLFPLTPLLNIATTLLQFSGAESSSSIVAAHSKLS